MKPAIRRFSIQQYCTASQRCLKSLKLYASHPSSTRTAAATMSQRFRRRACHARGGVAYSSCEDVACDMGKSSRRCGGGFLDLHQVVFVRIHQRLPGCIDDVGVDPDGSEDLARTITAITPALDDH